MKISLRRFLISITSLIVLCGVMTGVIFWHFSQSSKQAASALADAVESVAISQDLQLNLSIHRRQTLLQELQSKQERRSKLEETDELLSTDLLKLPQVVDTPEEEKIARNVNTAVYTYLISFQRLRQRGVTGPELYQKVAAQYDLAEDSLETLIDINLQQTKDIEQQVRATNRMGYIQMSTALVAMAFLIAALLWGFRKWLYLPILDFKSQLDGFEVDEADTKNIKLAGATEIQDIIRSFLKLSKRLTKQKELRLTFLSSIAHDLKNPLSAIKMSSEILSQEEEINPDNLELLSVISRQADHLSRLVTDLLDTTRVESGHLDLRMQPFDLGKVANDCVLLHQNISSKHKIEAHLPEQRALVFGDEQRITQVVNNLLSNAIKYSPAGGQITVSLKVEGELVYLSVTDQGLGIAPEEIESIFEPFRRSNHTINRIPGVGLGLSVSRKIIQAHSQGQLTVSSEPGKGSTFTVRLEVCKDLTLKNPLQEFLA